MISTKHDIGPCFYCPDLAEAGDKASLPEGETRHAGAARRIRVGDAIGLIDGKGMRGTGIVETVARRKLTVTIKERTRVKPPVLSLYIASAVPKGERFRTMIDVLTQIGVAGIVPLICDRSAVKPKSSSLDRWQRIAIEACKQSRNPRVPEILEPCSVRDALDAVGGQDALAFADMNGASLEGIRPSKGRLYLFVGPEGGFADSETNLLRGHGGRPLNLGGNVLRIETAAIVGAALGLLSAKL